MVFSLDTIRYDRAYDAALAAARRSPWGKKIVDNEIIDISTTNENFLKILFSAFAQKNGGPNAVTGSATYKNRKPEKSQHNAWDALSDFFLKIALKIRI